MTEHNPSQSDPTPSSPEMESLTAETFPPASKPEDEVNLNELFPDADQDLNDLFPEPELKSLLKKVHKHKNDIEKIKDRFQEDQDDADSTESEAATPEDDSPADS
jgi:hypothetical protein